MPIHICANAACQKPIDWSKLTVFMRFVKECQSVPKRDKKEGACQKIMSEIQKVSKKCQRSIKHV